MTPDKVNQADRALAAFIAGENGFAWTGQMYLDGQLDDDKIIEAIRHHRLSHGPADEGLLAAAIGLQKDLLQRAEWDGEAKVVCAGSGAWYRFCKAIDAALSSDGAE